MKWTPTDRERNIIETKRKVNAELAAMKAEEQRRAAKAEADALYREFITDGGLQESFTALDEATRMTELSELRAEIQRAGDDPEGYARDEFVEDQ